MQKQGNEITENTDTQLKKAQKQLSEHKEIQTFE
jgi:hypothetical protein